MTAESLPPGAIALVADDEPLLRMHVADLLEEAGFAVFEAHSALAALDHLDQHPGIALLFTDVEMPGGIDGVALAHEVQRRWPEVAIIVCSGRTVPEPGSLPAAARFIPKPFSPRDVVRLAQSAIGRS